MKTKKLRQQKTFDPANQVIELENEALKILMLPEMGGKIFQIIHKSSGTHFLKESSVDLLSYQKPSANDAFLPPYAAGFDECFPTVSPAMYHLNGDVISLPDHGELWTQSWNYKQQEKGISLWATGRKLNYRFTKHLNLSGSTIKINYELDNLEKTPFDYLWSAHPLLNIQPGDELLLPNEVSEVILNEPCDVLPGSPDDRLSWPYLFGNDSNINFKYVPERNRQLACKLFTNRLNEGYAGIYKKESDRSLIFSFDTGEIPFLGIWLCYGGWPASGAEKEYTVALEPCSGRPDSLEKAIEWCEQQKIASDSTKKWQLEMSIIDGKPLI